MHLLDRERSFWPQSILYRCKSVIFLQQANRFLSLSMDKLMNAAQRENISKEDDIQVSNIKQLSSESLFGNAKEIVILHLGESYMLTITKQRKLLLTKSKQTYSL